MAKRYINVAYKDREMAKRLGARWDPSVKRWYCPAGSALAKVYSWRKASGSPMSVMGEPSVSGSVAAAGSRRTGTGDAQLSFLA